KMVAVGDDSGIEVETLGGRPGPLSARYGGQDADDASRCRSLLLELKDVPPERRGARYVAVAAVASPSGALRLFRGECAGTIAASPRGASGFGYDPIFFYPPYGATFAEVTQEKKDAVSHRGAAFRALGSFLRSAEGEKFLRGGRVTCGW